jgi:sialic acid synthase SpsE
VNAPFGIGERRIGADSTPYVVADAGLRHEGDVQLGYKLVETAGAAGAHAVLFHRGSEDGRPDPLSARDFKSLIGHAHYVRLTVLGMPWDEAAVDLLASLDLPAYEVSAAPARNALLERTARLGRPLLLLASGLEIADVADAVAASRRAGNETLALLAGTSSERQAFVRRFPDVLVGLAGDREAGVALVQRKHALEDPVRRRPPAETLEER